MAHKSRGQAGTRSNPASTRVRRALTESLIALALIALAGFGLSACTFEVGNGADTTTSTMVGVGQSITTTTEQTTSTSGSGSVVGNGDGLASPAQAVATILGPSVVNIAVSSTSSQGTFGQSEYEAEGSGVIYTSDGMIVTNNHMATDQYGDLVEKIEVTLATGEKLPATVVGTDPLTDLAIMKVDAGRELPAATFVTEQPNVGEYAVAIGSPLGYENSVTLGIVSAVNRNIDIMSETGQVMTYTNLIQTDTPISPGNSGGALANAAGQVIGINQAKVSSSEAESIGFAIPSAIVTKVADEIISTGKATHAYIGVGTQTVTAELQQQFGLSRSSGILVAEVTQGGPADSAGIQQGDIIVKVDDKEMAESSDLLVAIRDRKPGDQVEVTIDRDGTVSTVTVTLQERPTDL